MTDVTLSVPDISCGHCKTSIEGAVGALPGVERVSVDIEGKTVAVSYDGDRLDLAAINWSIEEQGYEVA